MLHSNDKNSGSTRAAAESAKVAASPQRQSAAGAKMLVESASQEVIRASVAANNEPLKLQASENGM